MHCSEKVPSAVSVRCWIPDSGKTTRDSPFLFIGCWEMEIFKKLWYARYPETPNLMKSLASYSISKTCTVLASINPKHLARNFLVCVTQSGWDSIMFEQKETHSEVHNTNHDLYFRDAVQSQHNANRSFVLKFYLTSCLSTAEYFIENKVCWKVATSFFWLVDWTLMHVKLRITDDVKYKCLTVIPTKQTNKETKNPKKYPNKPTVASPLKRMVLLLS